ncbi:sensor histidine kinase [Rheinheimera sp. EpRS3]|uniref:sensor histidine kinase n=1 Tax=Rheinheimera sp. EpRS3 TaxID=1712383 RepID=UPI0007467ABF|nr:histidine kinase [Rheinheimera sp. EpRS3]KUM55284.1 two-component system sensor protein [Rheinheimera sp. EpRS3]
MKTKFDFAALAGVLTWLMVYGISIFILQRVQPGQSQWLIHLLFLIYGGLFIVLTREQSDFGLRGRFGPPLLILQLLLAFALLCLLPGRYFEFLPILTVIWAAMLPFVMRTVQAMLIVIIVVVSWFIIVAWQSGNTVWITALLYGSFHLFAVLVQSSTRDAEKAKEELEQKHQQLQATQQLLQAASRQSERTRIARNLHDVVGHHLTALTIQLQVASHITQGKAKIQVDKCHQLAKLLLSDVREAVSTMRQYAGVTLLDAITPLLALLPERLGVKLQIPPDIMLNDLHQAQHLLCMVQEAISNSLKHSGASQIYLIASVKLQQLQLVIYDNGSLAPHWQPGNGIKGMQERLAECGGHLQLGKQQQAIQLTITLPYIEGDNA